MQLTAHMLREAFRQTQREILDLAASDQIKSERYRSRWDRMAELLNEELGLAVGGEDADLTLDMPPLSST